MNSNYFKIPLLYLFIISFLGLSIRYGFFTGNFLTDYKYLLHTHSHLGFIGWVYSILFLLLTKEFLSEEAIKKGHFKLQFWLTQVLILGMLISFFKSGYGVVSIILSSIFPFLSYWFIISFYKCAKYEKNDYATKFVFVALFSLFFSSLGTWALAIVASKGFAGSDLYLMCIYFYLHFQYNGWFTFAIIALYLKKFQEKLDLNKTRLFFYLSTITLFSGYFLSLVGFEVDSNLKTVAGLSGLLSIIALLLISKEILKNIIYYRKEMFLELFFLSLVSIFSFSLKNGLQFLSVLPIFKELAFKNRFVVISYIHLYLIGFVTTSLLINLIISKKIVFSKLSRYGFHFLLSGFAITELLILEGGFGIMHTRALFGFSLLMMTGILLIVFFSINNESPKGDPDLR